MSIGPGAMEKYQEIKILTQRDFKRQNIRKETKRRKRKARQRS